MQFQNIYWVIKTGRKEKERRHRKETTEGVCILGCLAKIKSISVKYFGQVSWYLGLQHKLGQNLETNVVNRTESVLKILTNNKTSRLKIRSIL